MRLPATLAVQMQSIAVGWQIYDMTHQPIALGYVGLAQFLPVFGFALIAGHVADRFDRRRILMACIALQLVCSASLFWLAYHHVGQVWPIYAVLVLFGTARAFSAPASQSLLPALVPQESLGSAFAWSSSINQSMTIAGPALGGVVFGFGADMVYAVSGILLAIAVAATMAIGTPAREAAPRGISWQSVIAGISFIRSRPEILGAISLDLFAVLFGGATALLPVYARDILDVGPLGLGLLRSAPAAGAVLVGLALAHRSLGRRTGHTMFASVAVFGVATIVFGLSHQFWLSMVALTLLGASDMVSVFVRQNLVLRATPDAMRGRVNAVNFLFVGASNELGEMESGLTASWLGTIEAVVLGGVGTLAVMALWLWRFPALAAVDRLEDVTTG